MPARSYSRATRLSTAFLARQSGVDAAAAAFAIDRRTVRAWLKAGDVPDDEWTAIRDVLRARAAEMSARGTTSGLVAVLTGAGIADRNVRYSTLIERREARHAAEQAVEQRREDPETAALHEAVAALRHDQRRLFTMEIDLALKQTEQDEPPAVPDPEAMSHLLASVAELAALTPEQVIERRRIIDEHLYPNREVRTIRRANGRYSIFIDGSERQSNYPEIPEEYHGLPVLEEGSLPTDVAPMTHDPPQVPPMPPEPAQPVPPPSSRTNVGLHVVTDDEARDFDDQRHLWHPYDR